MKDIVDPMSKVKPGLVCGDTPVDLKGVHIRAKMLDMASEVNKYTNSYYAEDRQTLKLQSLQLLIFYFEK